MARTPAIRGVSPGKGQNRRTLLLALLRQQPISRVRLARQTRLSTTTVTNLVAQLMAQGVVEEAGADTVAVSKGAGRPPLALRLVAHSAFTVGVHITVDHMRLAVADLGGCLRGAEELPIPPEAPVEETLERAAEGARRLAERFTSEQRSEGRQTRLLGAGVGASGLVQPASGVNVLAPNLRWRTVPVRTIMEQALAAPVAVDNNVRCMALAESLVGAGRRARALAFVYARIGVGAGLVVNGRIYRGAESGAGEIGHWTMALGKFPGGAAPLSLEDLVSERVILAAAARLAPELVAGPNPLAAIFAAAAAGHVELRRLLDERAYYLGLALANLVDVMNPEAIFLGGFLHEGYDLLLPALVSTMRRHAFAGLADRVELLPATFGPHCGEVGAAILALNEFFLGATGPA